LFADYGSGGSGQFIYTYGDIDNNVTVGAGLVYAFESSHFYMSAMAQKKLTANLSLISENHLHWYGYDLSYWEGDLTFSSLVARWFVLNHKIQFDVGGILLASGRAYGLVLGLDTIPVPWVAAGFHW